MQCRQALAISVSSKPEEAKPDGARLTFSTLAANVRSGFRRVSQKEPPLQHEQMKMRDTGRYRAYSGEYAEHPREKGICTKASPQGASSSACLSSSLKGSRAFKLSHVRKDPEEKSRERSHSRQARVIAFFIHQRRNIPMVRIFVAIAAVAFLATPLSPSPKPAPPPKLPSAHNGGIRA